MTSATVAAAQTVPTAPSASAGRRRPAPAGPRAARQMRTNVASVSGRRRSADRRFARKATEPSGDELGQPGQEDVRRVAGRVGDAEDVRDGLHLAPVAERLRRAGACGRRRRARGRRRSRRPSRRAPARTDHREPTRLPRRDCRNAAPATHRARAGGQRRGGAVLSRTMSSVASSTRVWDGCSPRASAQDEAGAGDRHLDERLADRGQRRADPRGDRQVVEADDAQVLRDVEPRLAGRLVDAQRLEVVAGEDRRRRIRQAQERAPLGDALLDVEVAVADEIGIDRDAPPRPSPPGSRRAGPGCTGRSPVRRSRRSGGGRGRAGAGSPRGRRSSSWRRSTGVSWSGSPVGSTTTSGMFRGRRAAPAAPRSGRTGPR